MKNVFFNIACLCAICAPLAAQEIDAIKLREIMRETTAAHQDSAKLNADFRAQKERLEANIKLLETLKGKLATDISKEKNLLEEKKKRNAEALKELEQFAQFEKNLKSTIDASGLLKGKEFEDVYSATHYIFASLRESLKMSEGLYVRRDSMGKRFLIFGSAAEFPEKNNPEVSKICDMLEGKIPFDFVRLRIHGKAAQ